MTPMPSRKKERERERQREREREKERVGYAILAQVLHPLLWGLCRLIALGGEVGG